MREKKTGEKVREMEQIGAADMQCLNRERARKREKR